jgi:hypothetical protein
MVQNSEQPRDSHSLNETALFVSTTSFWWHYLTAWLPNLSASANSVVRDRSILNGVVELNHGNSVFPLQRVVLLDAMHTEQTTHLDLLSACNQLVLFTQGNKLSSLRDFLGCVARFQTQLKRKLHVLICVSLADENQLHEMRDLGGELELDATVVSVNASDNASVQSTIRSFLKSLKAQLPQQRVAATAQSDPPRIVPSAPSPTLEISSASQTVPTKETPTSIASDSHQQMLYVIKDLLDADGAEAAAVIDVTANKILVECGDTSLMSIKSQIIIRLVVMKIELMKNMQLENQLEDMIITLNTEYQIVRAIEGIPNTFICLLLRKDIANLAMAKLMVMSVAHSFSQQYVTH